MATAKAKAKAKPEVKEVVNVEVQVASLMASAYTLKQQLNEKVGDSEYDPSFHIARRYKEVKAELAGVVTDELVSVEHGEKTNKITLGGFTFSNRLQAGRKSLDQTKLALELVAEGLSPEIVQGCIARATKEGEPYWVNEIDIEKK